MSDETALVRAEPNELSAYNHFSISHVVGQTKAIKEVMQAVMKKDEHFGVIPGTGSKDKPPKPTLLQPGAEKLIMLFWLKAEFTTVERIVRDDFIMYEVKCLLKHRRTGEEWGEGIGACNSKERRYQSQTTEKVCPKCEKAGALMRGKPDFAPKGPGGRPQAGYEKGGWLCWKKKDGCGTNFPDDEPEIVSQDGQVKKDSVYDLQNTIFKMACKRAKVSAVLTATAASDVFTQDLEDLQEAAAEYIPPKAREAQSEAAPAPKASTVVQFSHSAPPAESGGSDAANSTGTNERLTTKSGGGLAKPNQAHAGEIAADTQRVKEHVAVGEVVDAESDWDPAKEDLVDCYRLIEEGHKKNNTYRCEFVPAGKRQRRSLEQNKKLQAMRHDLGLTDADWRKGLTQYYSKESSKELSVDEADDLIAKLQHRWNQRKYKHPDDKAAAKERRVGEAAQVLAGDMAEREAREPGQEG